METKASRLEKLSRIVPVPPFRRLRSPAEFDRDFLRSDRKYIVRGVSAVEDGERSSGAGQFVTLGPCLARNVFANVKKIFRRSETLEVIVQEFVSGPSGVAFCFAPDKIYLEYAREFAAVTGGKVAPSVAYLSDNEVDRRYRKLYNDLQKIIGFFGVCEAEFVGVENPRFVQVRPVTTAFEPDKEKVLCQMRWQLLSEKVLTDCWVLNDLSCAIAEHRPHEEVFADFYLRTAQRFHREVLGHRFEFGVKDIVRVGGSYFVSAALDRALTLNFARLVRFVWYLARRKDEFLSEEIFQLANVSDLMRVSYVLALADGLRLGNHFVYRQKLREIIDQKLSAIGKTDFVITEVSCSSRPDSPVCYDRYNLCWRKFSFGGRSEITVVPGEFKEGPFFRFRHGRKIPSGTVVVTDELYPEIAQSFGRIKGVICQNGSLNSHLAILARETGTPLKIQVSLKDYLGNE